jgi:hypothetical protein
MIRVIPLIVLLLGILAFSLTKNVVADAEPFAIHEDSFEAKIFSFYEGDYMEIHYTIDVVDGPAVDMMILDAENFQRYQHREAVMTELDAMYHNVKHISDSIRLYDHDKYYLIIDNTDYYGTKPPLNAIDDVATGVWDVSSFTHFSSNDNGNGDIPGFEFAFLIIAIASIYFIRGRKQRK